ncbi:cytochrome P450 [Fimicolochytrium jonesii]|uniref:cytochrome P450 n=1 Tax=Fimicolochytrium jonesii TaxID=1396493 RepID=UPI0022FF3837|nr:cytochrome P450 [Fimicolochytrium jonesii]KAI8822389.1 cytochrome P450 [Fimicolochytrium jonesii]
MSFVTVSLILLVAILLYKFLAPPPSLASLPYAPILKTLRGFIGNEPFDIRYFRDRAAIHSPKDGIARLWIVGRWTIVLTNPEYAKQVTANPNKFPKVIMADTPLFKHTHVVKAFGRNVVGTGGTEWKRHRNVVSPPFSRPLDPELFAKSVEMLIARLNDAAAAAEKDAGKGIDMYPWMQRLTLDVLGKIIFSFDFGSLSSAEPSRYVTLYNDLIAAVLKPIMFVFPFLPLLPLESNRRTERHIEEFRGLMKGMVADRRQRLENVHIGDVKPAGKTSQDLLDMMVESSNENKDPMHHLNEEELINDLTIFFVAGHDTTSNALSIALHYLAANPHIQDRARKHVRTVMALHPRNASTTDPTPSKLSSTIPSADAIRKFSYIHAIIKESLRLYPSATALGFRRCVEDTRFGTHLVPKGTWLQVDIFGMHRDPALWGANPDEFDPERFLAPPEKTGNEDEDEDDLLAAPRAMQNHPGWMPFGGGSRICLGMQFSLMEQKVALAMLLNTFRFSLPAGDPDAHHITLTTGGLLRPEEARICIERL